MKRFLVVLLCLIGGMTLLVTGGLFFFWFLGMARTPTVSAGTILEVDLETPFIEDLPDDPVASFTMRGVPQVRDFVLALDRAGRDRRVKGVVARIGGAGGMGMAVIQELRDAVIRFRGSGKFTLAYSEAFGDHAPGNGGYYLATAFDEIYLQPSGDLGLTGLMLEHPFLRGTFDLLGITPRLDQRKEYKNAMNFYTHTEFTEAHEEGIRSMLESWLDQIARGIGESRGLEPDEVRALANEGPYYGQEAVDAGLVDGLAYRDQVHDKARERADGASRFLRLGEYLERAGTSYRFGKAIAVIYGEGTVLRGSSQFGPFSGEMVMGSDTVSKAFRDAVADSRVRAIVFRVSCPGGSYPASDTIYRETVRAREAGKPVIVSMGNYATSGGYFVSLAADKIVAQPGTLTGSIGVLGGKMLNREMWGKIGMTFDEVHTSDNASMWSSLEDYTDAGYERFQSWLDRVYDHFTRTVSENRDLPLEDVLEVAKGRVWTGEEALEIGLVDALGGIPLAIDLAKEAAGIDADERVRLLRFPARRSAWSMLFDWDSVGGSRAAAETMTRTLTEVQPYGRLAHDTFLGPARHGILTTPPYHLAQP